MVDAMYMVGGVVYLLAALGYVFYDIFFAFIPGLCSATFCVAIRDAPNSSYLSYVFTTLLAAFWFVDALIYWLALCVHARPYAGRFVYWSAELGNVLASTAYLVSQAIYFHPDYLSTSLDIYSKIIVVQSTLYAAALLMWAVNSCQYIAAWRSDVALDPVKRSFVADLGFWVEFFNVWPSLGYFATAMWGMIAMFPVLLTAFRDVTRPDAERFTQFSSWYLNNQSQQLFINLAWDIGFTIDAILSLFQSCRKSVRSGGSNYIEMDDSTLMKKEKTFY